MRIRNFAFKFRDNLFYFGDNIFKTCAFKTELRRDAVRMSV